MGNLTTTIRRRRQDAGYIVVDVTGSASYATGGDSYTLPQLGANIIVDAIVDAGTPGYVLVPDLANKKIKFFKGAAGLLVEETAATNLSAVTGRVIVFCDSPGI